MRKERKVLKSGGGLLTGLILLCILLVAGASITGYEHLKALRDRQKLVEDKISRTMEKNLTEGMEKIEKKIIYQQLPQEERSDDEKLREELDRIREENRLDSKRTAQEVLDRLNIKEGLAEETLRGLQVQLESMKNDTSGNDHFSRLEENLGRLQEGLDGLENTAQSNKNSLIGKLETLEQSLIDYKARLDRTGDAVKSVELRLDEQSRDFHGELEAVRNQIQDLKNLSAQYEDELSGLKNLLEVYRNQNQLQMEQTNGRITQSEQQFSEQLTGLEQRMQTSLMELEQRFLTETGELEARLSLRIEALETALEQVYTKEEVGKMIEEMNLDDLNKRVDEIEKQVNECFQSVSDGKRKIASAITDKGINTEADAGFQQMADNIKGLVTMSSNPSVLFDTSSWTAPYDCVAVMSFSVGFKGNDDYKQKAAVTLSGVKSWETTWGETHDSKWHDWGMSGNVTWEAKAGQTYQLSFGTTSDGHILTWGWNSRTWIVPGGSGGRSRSAVKNVSFFDKLEKLDREGGLDKDVPWKKQDGTQDRSESHTPDQAEEKEPADKRAEEQEMEKEQGTAVEETAEDSSVQSGNKETEKPQEETVTSDAEEETETEAEQTPEEEPSTI